MRIGIIGAGASGLASARECTSRGHEVVVFEQGTRPGGVWAYNAEVEVDPLGESGKRVYSSLYKHLRTNLPSDLMAFRGFPFDETGGGDASWPRFPHHSSVYQYLTRFIERFKLADSIRYGTTVTAIEADGNRWRIILDNSEAHLFDAVFVCSGHFSEPRVPEISGGFQGEQLHSHNYRSAEPFLGRTVAVLGCGASGADIAQELSQVANVYWCGFKEQRTTSTMTLMPYPDDMTETSMLVGGQEYAVDVLLFCTGYHYHMPFLPKELVTIEDNFVSPLYRDIVPPGYKNLGFIGLPFLVVPFPLYAMQAKWFASQLDGEFDLPEDDEMAERCAARQSELEAARIKQRHFHRLGPDQEDYYNLLASECGAPAAPPWYGRLALEAQAIRQKHPDTFRDVPLKIPRQVHH